MPRRYDPFANEGRGGYVADPLDEAKAALARSQKFLREVVPSPVKTPRPQSKARQFTDLLTEGAAPVGVAGLVPGPQSGPLLALSALMAAPGAVRKVIAPEEDESRLGGATETALTAIPALFAARGLKSLAPVLKRFGPPKIGLGRVTAEGGGIQKATNPNQALAVARDVAGETGEPLAKVLTGKGGKTGFARGAAVEALMRLAGSGVVGRAGKLADEAEVAASVPGRLLRQIRIDAGTGARNVPRSTNPLLEALPEGGLGTVTPESIRRLTAGSRQSIVQDLDLGDDLSGFGTDLLAELESRSRRLQIPTRARAFQSGSSNSPTAYLPAKDVTRAAPSHPFATAAEVEKLPEAWKSLANAPTPVSALRDRHGNSNKRLSAVLLKALSDIRAGR